jgi:hypothetical protein
VRTSVGQYVKSVSTRVLGVACDTFLPPNLPTCPRRVPTRSLTARAGVDGVGHRARRSRGQDSRSPCPDGRDGRTETEARLGGPGHEGHGRRAVGQASAQSAQEEGGAQEGAQPPAPRPAAYSRAYCSADLLLEPPFPLSARTLPSIPPPPVPPPSPPPPLPSPTPRPLQASPTPCPLQGSLLGDFDIDEDSGVPVGEQLRLALVSKAGRVIDLFREWDTDGDGELARARAPPDCLPLPFTLTTHPHHAPRTNQPSRPPSP